PKLEKGNLVQLTGHYSNSDKNIRKSFTCSFYELIAHEAVNSEDPETWDSDTLYNTVEKCKEVIKLLEDKVIKGAYDEFGQPLTEDGLCSLVDSYQEESDFDDV
ncbi:13767_t:CDS:2, partial [Ambispora leptoticha]